MQVCLMLEPVTARSLHLCSILMATIPVCLPACAADFVFLPAARRHPSYVRGRSRCSSADRRAIGSRHAMTFSTKRRDICSARAKYLLALAISAGRCNFGVIFHPHADDKRINGANVRLAPLTSVGGRN